MHGIYVEEENINWSFVNDIRNVLVTEVRSGTLPSFCQVISKMKKMLIASLA